MADAEQTARQCALGHHFSEGLKVGVVMVYDPVKTALSMIGLIGHGIRIQVYDGLLIIKQDGQVFRLTILKKDF